MFQCWQGFFALGGGYNLLIMLSVDPIYNDYTDKQVRGSDLCNYTTPPYVLQWGRPLNRIVNKILYIKNRKMAAPFTFLSSPETLTD